MRSQSSRVGPKPAAKAYLGLIERFRLRPIETERELSEATALADELFARNDLRREEEEYLDVLCDLIEAYEIEHYAIPDAPPADVLRFLIDQRGINQKAVARETGVANSTITAILQGSRELNSRNIAIFSRYFGVEPAVFFTADETTARKRTRPMRVSAGAGRRVGSR